MTQLLNKNAFDADIIAYTNDLFIDSHGKRIGYINNESDESQPARIYKKPTDIIMQQTVSQLTVNPSFYLY